ncbi:NUDIX hydrolase [Candidatus Micrarchaeota archaeon]|nr:NUDIX hydrolase [Candidatus Micrarchaeota archaeon]
MKDDWRRLSRKTLHSTPWISFVKAKYRNAETKYAMNYYYCVIPSGSVVFPIDSRGRILLLYGFAPPLNKKILSPVSGTVHESESSGKTASRELLEETGLAGKLEKIASFHPGPFKSTGELTVFIATGVKKIAQPNLEPTETFSYRWMSLNKILSLAKTGKIKNGILLSALMLAMPRLRKYLRK